MTVDNPRGVAILPGSPEWLMLITPSKVAAILGESRWESPYRLWCRMKGLVPGDPPKDAFDAGHDLEPYCANRWRRQPAAEGWRVSPGEVQYVVPTEHFGFPAAVTLDRRVVRGARRRVLEFKSANTLTDVEQWGDDLSGDCPSDYAAQVMTQRLFAAAATRHQPITWEDDSHLFVVGPYRDERLYVVEYSADTVAWILDECSTFYASLAADVPPDLDDRPQTFECLKQLHPDIDGTDIEVDRGAALDYLEAVAAEKRAEAASIAAKNVMLDHMKSAKRAVIPWLTDAKGKPRAIADRRSNGKGGVSLYSGAASLIDDIRQHREETEP